LKVFLAAFAAMSLIALGLGLLAMVQLRSTAAQADRLIAEEVRDLHDIHSLIEDSERAARKARAFLLTGEGRFRDEYLQVLPHQKVGMQRLLEVIDTPEGRRLLKDIHAAEEATQEVTWQAMAARGGGGVEAASRLLLEDIQPLRDRLDSAFSSLLAHKQARIREHQQALTRTRSKAYLLVAGGLGMTALLALALGYLLWKTAAEHQRASDFERRVVAIVSHDLRNPLAVADLSLRQLEQPGALEERQGRLVQRALGSLARIDGLISSLLDFSRIRVGKLELHPQRICLQEVGAQVLEEMRAVYPERPFQCDAMGDTCGEWDVARLQQLTINLLDNAVKYGAPGTPIRAVYRDAGEDVLFSVHNQGAPIPEELRPRLFEPFERAGQPAAGSGTSSGLGLYIVREIVEAHHGRIDVHSTPQEGTTFTIRLPRRQRR
jgi:signal transduction histidine kinase